MATVALRTRNAHQARLNFGAAPKWDNAMLHLDDALSEPVSQTDRRSTRTTNYVDSRRPRADRTSYSELGSLPRRESMGSGLGHQSSAFPRWEKHTAMFAACAVATGIFCGALGGVVYLHGEEVQAHHEIVTVSVEAGTK